MGIMSRNRLLQIATLVSVGLYTPWASAEAVLEEIVVTATKRTQSVQDVPLSIEAVQGETLEAYDINNLNDLAGQIPNFSTGFGIATEAVVIRGLGSGQERSFEQAVGMFIDGLYMPRSRQYQSPFFDVERIEVMRGPQSVIHGLNATAGAVSTITRTTSPGDEFSADFSIDHEFEYGGQSATAVVGGSPSDTVGLRLAVKYTDRDGYFENSTTGNDEGDREDLLIRGSAVIQASDDLLLKAKVEVSDFETDGHIGEIYGLAAPLLEAGDGRLNWRRSSEGSLINPLGIFKENSPHQTGESTNVTLGAEYAMGENTLSVLLGYSDYEYDLITDLDTSASPLLDAAIEEEYEQTSIEVRLASPGDRDFDYLLGFYYHDSENEQAQPNIFGPAALGPGTALEATGLFELESELWSVFAQGIWNLSDTTRLVAGVRYSDEEKEVTRGSRCNLGILPSTVIPAPAPLAAALCPNGALDGFEDDRSSDNFMPEVALQWDLNDDVMLYGKASLSAKAGGFASATNAQPADLEYDDEDALGLELGLKARLADGAAELNVTVFRTEFDDLQVNSFIFVDVGGIQTTRPVIRNAAEAVAQGIEVDGRWALTEWLTVGGSAAVLDTEFDSFDAAPCNLVNATPSGVCDLGGENLPFAADWSGSLFADVDAAISDTLRFQAGVTLSHSDEYFTDGTLDPNAVQDSWTRVNARIGIASADDQWSIALVGKNLTEEEVNSTSQPLLGAYFLGYLDPPRTIALQARLSLGN